MNLLILDVDGVLTDGTKAYGPDGQVISKSFADIDFTAIKKFKEKDYAVCWLSADKHINEVVAKYRGIDFWYSREPDGTIDKVKWLDKLIAHYNAEASEWLLYVGDDLFDLPIMEAVAKRSGHSFYPLNAAPQFKHISYATLLNKVGGHGVVMELYNAMFPNDVKHPCT